MSEKGDNKIPTAFKDQTRGIRKYRWQKGQSGNPGGRPAVPAEVKAVKRASRDQLILTYGRYAFENPDSYTFSKKDNAIELGMQRVLSNFAKSGETKDISDIWDRVTGKPDRMLSLDDDEQTQSNIIVIEVPSNGRIKK